MNRYIDKQNRLQSAVDKVVNKLHEFKNNPAQAPENWNSWHDLHDRLNNRLIDNWKAYKSWHWDTYHFNAY